MIHTIQADFYRLFRSKGFWITEFILFALMLMGASIGATGHLMAIQTEEPEIPTQGWNGVQALINASSQGSKPRFSLHHPSLPRSWSRSNRQNSIKII